MIHPGFKICVFPVHFTPVIVNSKVDLRPNYSHIEIAQLPHENHDTYINKSNVLLRMGEEDD